jgi:hypothetical protein
MLVNKTEKALKFASRAARAGAKVLKGQLLVLGTQGAPSDTGMVTVCRTAFIPYGFKLSAASWLWPLQEEFAAQRVDACHLPRKACQRRWSCARVGVEVAKAAGMMPESTARAA